MSPVIIPLLSVCLVLIVAVIVRKKYIETGEMVLLNHLKDDWTSRLPFRFKNNRSRGVSRTCYQLFSVLYCIVKSIIILVLCAYYYVMVGILVAIKWTWRKIQHSTKTTYIEPENGLEVIENNRTIDSDECFAPNLKRLPNKTEQVLSASSPVVAGEDIVSTLWNYGSEIAWHEALDYYYALLRVEERVLDRYMEDIDADEIAQLSVTEFYDFLYDKYFVWKYTAKNRLATTRKSLKRYVDENKLHELANIQQRLFSADRSDIRKCLTIATEIRGLGPAGASGLLSVLFPDNFGTIDQYVVKALKKVEGLSYTNELEKMNPDSLSINNGVLLIQILREQANRLNGKFDTSFWTPRKVDMVLWAIGRDRK